MLEDCEQGHIRARPHYVLLSTVRLLATQPTQMAFETYRSVVKVEMGFLDAFTVVSLRVRQAKESFLKEGTGSC